MRTKFRSTFLQVLQEPHIDLLVNNAGIMALKDLEFTKQGFEKQIGVNHFGHFHLTSLLLPKMKVSTLCTMPMRHTTMCVCAPCQ